MIYVYVVSGLLFLLGLLKVLSGSSSPDWSNYIALFLLSAPAFYSLLSKRTRKASLLFSLLFLFSWIIEYIGLVTGFPYGSFSYGTSMGFKFFDVLPVLVPFGFVPLVLGAWYLTRQYSSWKRYFFFIGLLLLTDLALDPAAVVDGIWSYTNGVYFGVPISNYFGWIFSGSIVFAILKRFSLELESFAPHSLLYIISFWSGVLLAHMLYVPLIFGLITIFLCLKQVRKDNTHK